MLSHGESSALLPSLRDSLISLRNLFSWAPPRQVPFFLPTECDQLYVDAFVTVHGSRLRARELSDTELGAVMNSGGHLDNGIGALLLPVCGRPLYFYTQLPPAAVQHLANGEGFIFSLEAITPLLAALLFGNRLRGPYIVWEDNDSARGALVKGHTGNPMVNTLIGTYWEVAAVQAASPWLRRVDTADNAADSVSRRDFQLAKALGASRVYLPNNWWQILIHHLDTVPRTEAATRSLLRAMAAEGP